MPIIYQMRKFRKKKERKREIARKKKEEEEAKKKVRGRVPAKKKV